MNRHYTTEEYAIIVDKIRQTFDNASVTTDIMVGFPGETEEEFAASLAFAQKQACKAHVFAYSKREGTPAARRQDQIARTVKERRSKEMIAATAQTQKNFYRHRSDVLKMYCLNPKYMTIIMRDTLLIMPLFG